MSKYHAKRFWLFRGLSIQQRLPILICTLLLGVVIMFSWTSYIGVKNASLKTGQIRIQSLADQLSSMFGQSSQNFLTALRNRAKSDTIKKFVLSGGLKLKNETQEQINKSHKDSLLIQINILDANKKVLLSSDKPGSTITRDLNAILNQLSLGPDSVKIGNLFASGDSVYYPVAAAITDHKKIIGYIVRFRKLIATSKSIEQISKLMGTNALFYLGNSDGSIWSDLQQQVSIPEIDTPELNNFFEFDSQPVKMLAVSELIPHSPWRVLVGFPKKSIFETSAKFIETSMLIGLILIVIAMFIAWRMSRNITKPLKKLTNAASLIASGEFSAEVPTYRNDELGKLARAFNAMRINVQEARTGLEKKVQERTIQLQAANKELEAFSYSVSHDLRAPLRAIGGYSMILKEEYGAKLDDEANRLTDKIIFNAQMMGQLIDSLISFSQMGTAAITQHSVNMNKLAESCLRELLLSESPGKYKFEIKSLPSCLGDPNLIKQVWINLISNAIKYSSKTGYPLIEIGCTEGSDLNIYYIKDNGAGFDMNYAHKLFGVFQRLHHQRDYEGTGIGLALTKRILNKHNGDIWADSEPGKGACFYFSLPASKENKIVQRKIVYESNS